MHIKTQAEFEANINGTATLELLEGVFGITISGIAAPNIVVHAGASLDLVARESSQPRVEAWGSSQPRVVARESSQPRVVAWESSQPRVEAWGSSQPRVEASGYVQLSVFGHVIAKCAATVAVLIEGAKSKITGGKKTTVKRSTAAQWCSYYGVEVKRGVAILYKGLNADFKSLHGTDYTPGLIPVAKDWDGGKVECGGGLHFSPTAAMTKEFHDAAAKFVACRVRVADMRTPKPDDSYANKIKAKGCCAPCVEVNEDGEEV